MAHAPALSRIKIDCANMADAVTSAFRMRGKSDEVLARCAAVANSLGFDGFSYLLLRQTAVDPELVHHWTTAGSKWTAHYAARGYHLIDPRVTKTQGRIIPIVWNDVSDCADPRAQAFLADARRHSIRSGVAMSLHDDRGDRAVVAWDSQVNSAVEPREASIRARLGTLSLLAGFIHEAMTRDCRDVMSHRPSTKLTHRERECLTLAARGLTSADIALKLRITERTVNFHIGNILAKLGALNRGEAIARGVALNLVSMEH